MRQWAAGLVAALSLSAPAGAQEGGFKLTNILVTSIEADQPFLLGEAERVQGLIEDALDDHWAIVTMDMVVPFADYDAEVYLRSCPQGQYIGCVFVLGERAKTVWTVGGRISAVQGGYRLDVSIIDVAKAQVVTTFDVDLDGSNDAQFQQGLVQVFQAMLSNDLQQLDVRGDQDALQVAAAEQRERDARARDFVASSIDEVEEEQELVRGTVGEDARYGDLDEEDDDRRSDRRIDFEEEVDEPHGGGLHPWEQAGLSKLQYRAYKRSKMKLRDFRPRLQGRKGDLLLRLGMGVNSGPWGQRHETWWAQDHTANPNNLQAEDILEQAMVQDQRSVLAFAGELGIGYGVASWLDMELYGSVKAADYQYRLVREVRGIEEEQPTKSTSGSSYLAGLRFNGTFLPALTVHPTVSLGASYWTGVRITSKVSNIEPLLVTDDVPANNMVFADVGAGVAADLGKTIIFYGRVDLNVPVAGRHYQSVHYGEGHLSQVPEASRALEGGALGGMGFGASLGLQMRFDVGRR